MEPGEPYYHRQQPPPPPTINADDTQLLYPLPSVVSSPSQTAVRRKRGRPRKYSTPEQAAAAKRLSSLPTIPPLSPAVGGSSTSSKKSSHGNAGQGFTPYIITVTAGEDINHKIMSFMQQSKQEICVISASGFISNACLRQPATSGGNIVYEGRFDILSLCGSYVRADFEGRSGGLSICMAGNDGQIIGGGVDGPLIAVGPVQVVVGTFVTGGKNTGSVTKDNASVGAVPSLPFSSAPDSSARNLVISNNDNHQNSNNGYPFMIQNGGMPMTSTQITDWNSNDDSAAFNFSGRGNHGANNSPKNDDYGHFQN